MSSFVIDEIIREQFKYLQNLCSMLSEHKESEFDSPATLEKIMQWEKVNDVDLPHQYKSWLLLTSESRILDGYVEFSWPELGTYENENDVVIIGTKIGDGEDILIARSTGKLFSDFDGIVEEYSDFDDLLTSISFYMESEAREFYGEDWGDIYDEQFGMC